MRFADIPGLEKLKNTLVSSYKRNHIAHAQLFNGKPGGPALPIALAYATYLLCEAKADNDACGVCPSCQKMAKYIHPDVHFFYPQPGKEASKKEEKEASKRAQDFRKMLIDQPYSTMEDWIQLSESENKVNQISKDMSRTIIKTVSMKSFEGGLKIIILWCPETLHPSAANAILKVLEEPPTQTIYLLVSYQFENLITTILSRTQHVLVPNLTVEQIMDLVIEKKGVDPNKARNAAILSEGNIGQALKLSAETDNIAYRDFQEWMQFCYRGDFDDLVRLSEEFNKMGKSIQRSALSFALMEMRSALMAKGNGDLILADGEERDFITKFSNTLTLQQIEGMYREFSQTLRHLERNANPRITHLALSLRLSRLLHKN